MPAPGLFCIIGICLVIILIMTLHDHQLMQYNDCGSLVDVDNIQYRECRGLFCSLTQSGEQEVVIRFRTNEFPFGARELYHNINWHHNNYSTNHLTIHEILCDGNRDCSMTPDNGTHSLVASFTILHEVTHYGIFTWESWNDEAAPIICIEAVFYDEEAVLRRTFFYFSG